MASQCLPCDEANITWTPKFATKDDAIAFAKENLKFFPTGTMLSLSKCCRRSDDSVSVSCPAPCGPSDRTYRRVLPPAGLQIGLTLPYLLSFRDAALVVAIVVLTCRRSGRHSGSLLFARAGFRATRQTLTILMSVSPGPSICQDTAELIRQMFKLRANSTRVAASFSSGRGSLAKV